MLIYLGPDLEIQYGEMTNDRIERKELTWSETVAKK
jgi:hypothetical protein